MVIPGAKICFLNILARDDIYLRSFVSVGRLETNLLFDVTNFVTNVEQY